MGVSNRRPHHCFPCGWRRRDGTRDNVTLRSYYIGSEDNNLYAVDPAGQVQWVFPTADRITASPAAGADGTVYVGSRDNNLYAINSDGTAKWVFPTQGTIISSLTIGPSGTLYVGSRDNNIYAVNGDSGGPANSPWPMFRYDATHTGQQPFAALYARPRPWRETWQPARVLARLEDLVQGAFGHLQARWDHFGLWLSASFSDSH